MQISVDEDIKNDSSLEESVESGETSSSNSEWNLGSDELFVTCLNCDICINTSLNQMSIWYRLVSQPEYTIISNSDQLFNAMDLSAITFGLILPPNPRDKNSTNSRINLGTSDKDTNFRVHAIKILLNSGASASIVHKDVTEISRIKGINGQLWQGPLILLL